MDMKCNVVCATQSQANVQSARKALMHLKIGKNSTGNDFEEFFKLYNNSTKLECVMCICSFRVRWRHTLGGVRVPPEKRTKMRNFWETQNPHRSFRENLCWWDICPGCCSHQCWRTWRTSLHHLLRLHQITTFAGNIPTRPCLKKQGKLSLSELRQMSTNFDNFWQKELTVMYQSGWKQLLHYKCYWNINSQVIAMLCVLPIRLSCTGS